MSLLPEIKYLSLITAGYGLLAQELTISLATLMMEQYQLAMNGIVQAQLGR